MFSNLIGNHRAKVTLRHLLTERRVPNAFLFAGPEGVGKKRFAIELAKAFVCVSPEKPDNCGCAACQRAEVFIIPKAEKRDDFKQIFFSGHADVAMAVPFNRNILVDAIRDLEREAHFLPYEGRARFFIVDDADKMTEEASNALLRTLEEPPTTSHVILVSSRPDSLLTTIRSRCQILRFAPVEAILIEQFLILEKGLPANDAKLAARLSAGSVGRALSLNLEKYREGREKMLRLLENLILRLDRASILAVAESLNDAANKDHFEENLTILASIIHDIWTIRLGSGASDAVNSDVGERLERLASRSDSRTLSDWMDEIEVLRDGLAVNLNRKIASDALFMQMAG